MFPSTCLLLCYLGFELKALLDMSTNVYVFVMLQENQPLGTVLGAVTAISQSTLVYTIGQGNHDDCFFLNPSSGVLTTSRVIDYEQHRFFNLTVQATNIIGASATMHVLVHITDENDNLPLFFSPVFYGNVSESAEPGSIVLTTEGLPLVVRATDADSGPNSLLQFDIIEQEVKQFFVIDANTGAIRTVASLDHETRSQFNFTVQVQDRGTPRLTAQSPAEVVIFVSDINDTPPRFTEHTYQASVLLPTYIDVTVVKVEAVDPDTNNDMTLTYSIVDGNEGNIFGINPQSGVLHVEQAESIQPRSVSIPFVLF